MPGAYLSDETAATVAGVATSARFGYAIGAATLWAWA
jgi:hypothetical protein